MSIEFYWIAVAAVTIVSASRLTRLAVHDKFPPVKIVRDWLFDLLDKTPRRRQWQMITWCGYCASFWVTSAVTLWAWFAGVFDSFGGTGAAPLIWWLFNGTMAGSYLAVILMSHDGDTLDDDEDEDA